MEPYYTKKESLSLDLVRNIDSPLEVFESFAKQNRNSHCRGLIAELLVIAVLTQKKHYQLLHHRKKIAGTEIDLIFKTPNRHFVLVEVKSRGGSSMFMPYRWSYSQKERFKKALSSLQSKSPQAQIWGLLALVDSQRVEFLYLDEVDS